MHNLNTGATWSHACVSNVSGDAACVCKAQLGNLEVCSRASDYRDFAPERALICNPVSGKFCLKKKKKHLKEIKEQIGTLFWRGFFSFSHFSAVSFPQGSGLNFYLFSKCFLFHGFHQCISRWCKNRRPNREIFHSGLEPAYQEERLPSEG